MIVQRPRPLDSASNYKSGNYIRECESLQDWRWAIFELLGGCRSNTDVSWTIRISQQKLINYVSDESYDLHVQTIIITNNNGSKHLLRGTNAPIIKICLE